MLHKQLHKAELLIGDATQDVHPMQVSYHTHTVESTMRQLPHIRMAVANHVLDTMCKDDVL